MFMDNLCGGWSGHAGHGAFQEPVTMGIAAIFPGKKDRRSHESTGFAHVAVRRTAVVE